MKCHSISVSSDKTCFSIWIVGEVDRVYSVDRVSIPATIFLFFFRYFLKRREKTHPKLVGWVMAAWTCFLGGRGAQVRRRWRVSGRASRFFFHPIRQNPRWREASNAGDKGCSNIDTSSHVKGKPNEKYDDAIPPRSLALHFTCLSCWLSYLQLVYLKLNST